MYAELSDAPCRHAAEEPEICRQRAAADLADLQAVEFYIFRLMDGSC